MMRVEVKSIDQVATKRGDIFLLQCDTRVSCRASVHNILPPDELEHGSVELRAGG